MFGSEIKNNQNNLMYEMVCGDCQILYSMEIKEDKTGENVACMGEKGIAFAVLVGKPEGNKPTL